MRLPAFLFALCLAAMVAFGAVLSSPQPKNAPPAMAPSHDDVMAVQSNDGSRMWRAELESLRTRVAQVELESTNVWLIDSNVRQQLSSQVQLMKEMLRFAEQQQSDRGKGPTALAVERRLNQLQGQTMCEACHSGIVAQNHAGGNRAAR
jgi:hypothetical protein